jgi:DNA mismatch endonuclease (patch repair protein)
MTDVHTPEVRSKNMRAIRSGNTKPELLVRKALHAAGYRFRLHSAGLPGKPDIVLPKYRTVIFVHGCFWHGHDCKYFKLPKTRPEFWSAKIEANRARDARNIAELQQSGWRIILIWECAIRSGPPGLNDIITRLGKVLYGSADQSDAGVTIITN